MNDYISRQAAIDAICKHGTELERRGITVLTVVNHKQVTVDLLENLPSAEVEPVKHGRWEFEAKWQYKNCDGRGMERKEIFGTTKRTCNRLKCSKCKKVVVIDDTIAYAYCPHCGAKMDLGGEPHEQN